MANGRFGHDFYLAYADSSLTVGCSDTIASRISTADDKYFLVFSRDTFFIAECLSGQYPVLLCQHFHSEMYAFQFASRYVQVAGFRCSGADGIGIKPFGQVRQIDFCISLEADTFVFHDFQATVDNRFMQLEVRNTEAKQSANVFGLFENCYIVSSMIQLIGCCQSRRSFSSSYSRT